MYKMRIYIKGSPGFFEYEVTTKDQAMQHFAMIVTEGYRRVSDTGIFEWYAPHLLKIIKIDGPNLDAMYPDKFLRT